MSRYTAAAYIGAAACTFLFAADSARTDPFTHIVAPGESVSLICIDYYGRYAPAMGDEIRKLNPRLKRLELIYPGQQLRLPAPDTASAETSSKPAVFSQSITVTQAVVTYVDGDAALQKDGETSAIPLAANTIVSPGDVLRTGKNGRVELIINRESVVRMRENSRLRIDSLRDAAAGSTTTTIRCPGGGIWTKVRRFADKITRFQLIAPNAIAGVHGTVYQTDVSPDSSMVVKVYDGEVSVKSSPSAASGNSQTAGAIAEVPGPSETSGPHEVSMEQWTRIVRSMQRIHIGPDGKVGEPEQFEREPEDSWEQWNEQRDRRIAALFGEAR
jgi:LysM repeat protein